MFALQIEDIFIKHFVNYDIRNNNGLLISRSGIYTSIILLNKRQITETWKSRTAAIFNRVPPHLCIHAHVMADGDSSNIIKYL